MDWRKAALDIQQEMCENFDEVNWDMYEEKEVHVLKDKIRVILNGPSTDRRHGESETLVNKVCEVIVKEGTCKLECVSNRKAIYVVFIFIVGTDDGHNVQCWPVFKVPKDSSGIDSSFVDLNCRVYKDWKDFLSNNKLPAREYCYPRNGNYFLVDGRVSVQYGKAPQVTTKRKICNVMDVASSVVAVGSTAVTAASLVVPVAGPFLALSMFAGGVFSAYSALRSSNTLHDRRIHKQSIGLKDKESRGCYLSIVGGVVGFGATAATSATIKAAQAGRTVGKLASTSVTALKGSALVISGVGVANDVHHLFMKHQEGKKISSLEIMHFSTSLLLFCHATVNFQTARSIIEKSQEYVLQDFERSLGSKWKRVAFRNVVKCSNKLSGTHGKSLVIRGIRQINSVDDYFACFENAILRSEVSGIEMLNLDQKFGLLYLDALLSACEKFQLSKVLNGFTEPFQKIIMKLCDYLFHSITRVQAQGFDFIYIACFITEYIGQMVTFIFNGGRKFVLSLLACSPSIRPSSEMTDVDFCFAVMGEILRNPSSILVLYNHVQSFFQLLLDKSHVHAMGDCKIDFIQFFSACGILLKTDKLNWEIIMDFAKQIFDSLNLRKFSSLVHILKEVCLFIQKNVLDMQRRYNSFRSESNASNTKNGNYDSEMQVNFTRAIDLLLENGHESFEDRIRQQNIETILNGEQPVYSEDKPSF